MNYRSFMPDVIPNEDYSEAVLIGFRHVIGERGVSCLESLPQYRGVYSLTPQDDFVSIDYACVNGLKIPITKIQSCSFSHCKRLKTIYIAKHIHTIEWNMFGCDNLQNIEVDANNEHFVSIDGVLFTKNKKCLVGYPSGRQGVYTIPEGTTKICNCAFKSSKLSEINIPSTVQHIGTNVFYECKNLKTIVVPTTLKTIEPNFDKGHQYISQEFFFDSDENREHPLSIQELIQIKKQ